FKLSPKGTPEVGYDATGGESFDPVEFPRIRVSEMENFLAKGLPSLGGNADNMSITVLNGPDFNPFQGPRNDTKYGITADWNADLNRQVVLDKLNQNNYDFLLTMGKDPAIHPAHDEGHRVAQDAVSAYEAQPGKAGQGPPILESVEEGWYPLNELKPLNQQPYFEINLSPQEFNIRRDIMRQNYSSQPPGNAEYFGSARGRELLRYPADMPQWKVDALNQLLATSPPIAPPSTTYPPLTHIDARNSGPPTTIQTVPPRPVSARPALSGPQTTDGLKALMDQAQSLGRSEAGGRPVAMTPDQEAQWFYLTQAGDPYVPPYTSLKDRLGLIGSGDGGFWNGPRQDTRMYASSDVPLHDAIGPQGTGLPLTGDTKPWSTITGARGEATQLFNDKFAPSGRHAAAPQLEYPPVFYTMVGPANVLADAVRNGHIPPELIDGGTPVINSQGGVSPLTAANPNATYAPKPGDAITEPTKSGVTAKELRSQAYKVAGTIGATAAGTYAGLRGLGLDPETATAILTTAGLPMFGYRSGVGAATWLAKNRLARGLEPIVGDPANAGQALDKIQNQITGWRGVARGIPALDRGTLGLQAELLRANPEDADAARALDTAPDSMVAPNSPLGKLDEAVRTLSYGPNNAGNASRIFSLDPANSLWN
ncbi:MAG: hypothetical protein ACRECN_04035, partial [Methylocella sp.]